MAPQPDRPPDAHAVACPCGHGGLPAEIAGQRPLRERAAAGDREAFARIYDQQVDGVYRYLLAWTGDRTQAAELAGQVFRSAPRWLPATAGDQNEAGAWLIAMARDAVQGPAAGRDPPTGPPRGAVEAAARLGGPQREVAVLRLLCGHSLGHTAHLSGYTRRAVLQLQLAACLAISDLTDGARGSAAAAPDPGSPPGPAPSPEEFERQLGRPETDPAGSDPALAGALAAAASLRQAVPGYVVAPDDTFVRRLRQDLVAAADPNPPPGPADRRCWRDRLSTGWREISPDRRPWVATAVATVGIVVVLALQAFGDHGQPPICGDRPCPAPTTAAAAAGADSSPGTALTTVAGPSTTSTTGAGQVAPPAAPRTSTAATPPPARPATTAPQTTGAPRTTTTTAPPTTAPPTTAAPTTTTAAPVTT